MAATTLPPAVHIDPCPELPIELGPENEGVGSWVVRDKYRYLRTYLNAARYAMSSERWSERIYIDPFCATGRIQVRGEDFTRPGGAAEAWHALEHTPGRWTKMFVGDMSEVRVNACSQRLRALGANVQAFHGAACDTVVEMVSAVPKRSLCIAFVDPYDLSRLDFGMLRELSKLRVDLIVHFSTMDLLRNADAELDPKRARFDTTAPGWREQHWAQTTNKGSLPVALESYWRSLVEGLGLRHSTARPLITNDQHRGIYRLYFFARHDLPLKLWKDVARSPNGEFDF